MSVANAAELSLKNGDPAAALAQLQEALRALLVGFARGDRLLERLQRAVLLALVQVQRAQLHVRPRRRVLDRSNTGYHAR